MSTLRSLKEISGQTQASYIAKRGKDAVPAHEVGNWERANKPESALAAIKSRREEKYRKLRKIADLYPVVGYPNIDHDAAMDAHQAAENAALTPEDKRHHKVMRKWHFDIENPRG